MISNKQFNSRKGLSTTDTITTLTIKIYKFMDRNIPALCVFLDLAKAFDTVPHKKLLDALDDEGIRGATLQLFRSYLKNRVQAIKIGEVLAEEIEIDYGIPQGTVLGPLLFSIYMNELLKSKTSGDIVCFVDETAILYTSDTWTKLKDKTETNMRNILTWFHSKGLSVNFNKTHFFSFTSYVNNLPSFDDINITDEERNYKIIREQKLILINILELLLIHI